jgi:hypothetical protein
MFDPLPLFSRQLRNFMAMPDKPLIGFILQGMSIVWNNVKASEYLAHPSKYPEN